ncbi:MAG: hypothetical protein U5K55_15085 [Aliarcobacter sp.]|nr:hypothetical protein [Aliarcobacter sp.]
MNNLLKKIQKNETKKEQAKESKKEEKFTAREKEFLYKKKLRSQADLLVEK